MSAERKTTSPEPIAFKAEIRQLLDILIHSLYTEREIFLRELVSNASDALNRLRFETLTNREIYEPDTPLEIKITSDKENRTLTISDTGIGMTIEELTTNLGTIAQSGARAFIEAATEQKENLSDIIGQFGVGFYSAFMVAESITVTSRSYLPDAEAGSWYSTGGDTFTVTPAEKEHRGTTVEIKLKEDADEFNDEHRLSQIVKRHSDYVAFPIRVGDEEEQANRQTAIWRQSPGEVDAEEYSEFYKHLTMEFEAPLKHTHLTIDAPIQMYAILYIPGGSQRGMFSLRKEDGLKLYARKILIQAYSKDLLPEYYRFIQGVVDAEDLPLNVSRETVQSTAIMNRLKKVLTSRVNGTLKEMAKDKKNPETYIKFWENFGQYIKEGISSDLQGREVLYPLIRFHTTKFTGEWTSLDEYVGRMKPEQKKIYYLLGTDQQSATSSPHLDYFGKHEYEVILFTEPIDSFMLLGLPSYEGFDLQNVAAADMELPQPEKTEDAEPAEKVTDDEFETLVNRFKEQLGDRVSEVRSTDRLSESVARLVDPEGALNPEMQRVYKMMDQEFEVPQKVLELNPSHPILLKLSKLTAEHALNKPIIEQVYANAQLIEGLAKDPASMISNIRELMEAALG